jgi:hypothetical protein
VPEPGAGFRIEEGRQRLETKRLETKRLETKRLETKRLETKRLETMRLSHISAEKDCYQTLFNRAPPSEQSSQADMAARVVSLGRLRTAPERGLPQRPPVRRHIWRGASGREYAHSVYSLIECPPLPMAGYVLVRRDECGRCRPLRVGVGQNDAPTLNLAQVRQRGARAGANEVHLHLDAASEAERRLVACDLRAGIFGSLADAADTEVAGA